MPRICVQLFSPDQPCLLTLVDHCLKKAAKHLDAIACANTRQTRMIRERFVQMIAQIPSDAEAISGLTHELPFRTHPFKKHDQLELEKHNGINRRTTRLRIVLLDKFIHKRQIQLLIKLAIKMVSGYQIFERDRDERDTLACFCSHHGGVPLPLHRCFL